MPSSSITSRKPYVYMHFLAVSVCLYFAVTVPILVFSVDGESVIGLVRNIAPGINDISDEDLRVLAETLLEVDLDEFSIVESYSVIGGSIELFNQGSTIPALAIMIFSVVMPAVKLAISAAQIFANRLHDMGHRASIVHKLSMLDVFVAAIIVFVISRSTGYEVSVGTGFYIFLGYFFLQFGLNEILRFSQKGETHASM